MKEGGKIEGDFVVDRQIELTGMITGIATVVAGGVLVRRGMVCRDLVVAPGGSAIISGTVVGDLHNRGGEVDVYGTIY
jgi:hypothetical protein